MVLQFTPDLSLGKGLFMNVSPDLQSCLLCDDVRQERNGKFILIGLFDALWGPNFPLKYPRLCMVTRWCSGEGEFIQSSRILKPDRSSVLLQGKDIPVRLKDDLHTATNVEFFMNVSFDEPGVYWIEVNLDQGLKLTYPLRIGQVAPKNPPGQTPE